MSLIYKGILNFENQEEIHIGFLDNRGLVYTFKFQQLCN